MRCGRNARTVYAEVGFWPKSDGVSVSCTIANLDPGEASKSYQQREIKSKKKARDGRQHDN